MVFLNVFIIMVVLFYVDVLWDIVGFVCEVGYDLFLYMFMEFLGLVDFGLYVLCVD